MSFLKRLKDRRSRGGANSVTVPQVPVSPPKEEDVEEMRVGPLADFVMGSGKDCVVDLGLAQGGWSQAKQKSRLSKTTRVRAIERERRLEQSRTGWIVLFITVKKRKYMILRV